MEHSIIFDDTYDTYNDWHLIPQKRPSIDPPNLEYMYTPDLSYQAVNLKKSADIKGIGVNRSGSVSYYVENGYVWYDIYSAIMSAIHGKICKIVLADEPDRYYIGRVTVGAWSSEPQNSTISLSFECEPYKYGEEVTVTFNQTPSVTFNANTDFVTPAIVTINPVVGIASLTLTGLARDRITQEPEDINIKALANGGTTIIDGINKTILENGANKFADADMWAFPTIVPGSNTITSDSNAANITIKYTPRFL